MKFRGNRHPGSERKEESLCPPVHILFIWSSLCYSWAAEGGLTFRKSRAPPIPHLTINSLDPVQMDRAKENRKRCLALHTGDLVSGPKHNPYFSTHRTLELCCPICVPSLLSHMWSKEHASGFTHQALGVTILGPRGCAVSWKEFCWGAEIGVSPSWAALAIICILKKPRIGGLNFWSLVWPRKAPVQGVRTCGGSRPRSWHKGLTIPIPTCRDHSILFNCQAGTSPFKLNSGVILHKVLPTCSFFFLYV